MLRNYWIKSIVLLLLFMPGIKSSSQNDDIIEQKKELEQIINELENSRKNLDSLKRSEKSILKQITNYEQQASANKTVLKRLKNRLYKTRGMLLDSKLELEESHDCFSMAWNRYITNLKYYYMGTRSDEYNLVNEIDREKAVFKRMVYLRALAAGDKKDFSKSSEYLVIAEKDYNALVKEEARVGAAHKEKRSEYVILTSHQEKSERELYKLRRKKEHEADRLIILSETARQMEDLVARLEKARLERERSGAQPEFDYSTGNFASYKGGLPFPLEGKITKSFGWKTDKITYLKSFSPGIEISGRKKAPVVAVADGVVAYTAALRGYGNFVIVEHEDGYYSIYSGLENLLVEKDRIVSRGQKLGNAPTGIIKFELRQGRESIDPVEWIRFDSFK